MKVKNKIIRLRQNDPYIKASQIAREFKVSRVYVHKILKENDLATIADERPEDYDECTACGDSIVPSLALKFKGGLFCNKKCHTNYRFPTLICERCGKEFKRNKNIIEQRARQKLEGSFCSYECYQIKRSPPKPDFDLDQYALNEWHKVKFYEDLRAEGLLPSPPVKQAYRRPINKKKYRPFIGVTDEKGVKQKQEALLRDYIVEHFNSLGLKNFKVLNEEVKLPNAGRVDILLQSKLNNKLVPVELKFKGETKLRSQIMTYVNYLKETQGYTLKNKDYHGLDCERGIIITGDVRYAVDIALTNDPVDIYEWDIDDKGLYLNKYQSITKILSYCFDKALMENKAYTTLKDALYSGEEIDYRLMVQLGNDLFKDSNTKKTIGRLFAADFKNSV